MHSINPRAGTTSTNDTALAAALITNGRELVDEYTSDEGKVTFVFLGSLSDEVKEYYKADIRSGSQLAFARHAFLEKRDLVRKIKTRTNNRERNKNYRSNDKSYNGIKKISKL